MTSDSERYLVVACRRTVSSSPVNRAWAAHIAIDLGVVCRLPHHVLSVTPFQHELMVMRRAGFKVNKPHRLSFGDFAE